MFWIAFLREAIFRLATVACFASMVLVLGSCGGVTRNTVSGSPGGTAAGGTPGGSSGGSTGGTSTGAPTAGSPGAGGTPNSTSTFVYVVDASPNAIETYRLDPSSGALTSAGAPFSIGHNLENLAISPDGRFGYGVANDFTNNVFNNVLLAFTFDPSSGLPTLKQTLQIAGTVGGWTAVDPSGRFLYVSIDTNEGTGNGIASYSIQSDGSLVQNGALTPTDVNPGRISIDPRGRFLYTDTEFTNRVWGFAINSTTGTLTPVPNTPFTIQRSVPQAGKEPTRFNEVIDPTGQRLFSVDNINSRVNVFTIDQNTGGITLQGSTATGQFAELFAPAMDPKGRFLYIGEFNTNAITGFAISDTTTPTLPPIPGLPVTTSGAPNWWMVIDPTGSYVYSVEVDAIGAIGNLDGYQINQTGGTLTRLTSTPLRLQGSPVWIAISR